MKLHENKIREGVSYVLGNSQGEGGNTPQYLSRLLEGLRQVSAVQMRPLSPDDYYFDHFSGSGFFVAIVFW